MLVKKFPQFLKKLKRGPQVVVPKDLGAIIAYTGIGKESVVVDAGTGSGFLAIFLANICKKVITYEIREDFYKLALENIKLSGLKNIEIKNKDVFSGIDEENVDLVTLDLPNAERALEKARVALKENGYVVGILPNMEQLKSFYQELKRLKFKEIFALETIHREIMVREEGTRPVNKEVVHTAYLCFGKK
jgi:tRNA (adenine57-N1/adenine58-N1)-methyltransferase